MLSRVHIRFGMILLLAGGMLSSSPIASQQPEPAIPLVMQSRLDALASRLSEEIRLRKVEAPNPRILVMDFPTLRSSQISRLGVFLAERISNSLSADSKGFVVLDRSRLYDFLKENRIQEEDLLHEASGLAVARELGATGRVSGTLIPGANDNLRISLELKGLGPVWEGDADIILTEQMRDLLGQSIPRPFPESETETIPLEPGVFTSGADGVTSPSCEYCPDPNYTNLARAFKWQGTVVISVVVTAEGKATAIKVVKGAPFGMTKQAILIVGGWRFKPGEKDGKPVSVRVRVETTFRLF